MCLVKICCKNSKGLHHKKNQWVYSRVPAIPMLLLFSHFVIICVTLFWKKNQCSYEYKHSEMDKAKNPILWNSCALLLDFETWDMGKNSGITVLQSLHFSWMYKFIKEEAEQIVSRAFCHFLPTVPTHRAKSPN